MADFRQFLGSQRKPQISRWEHSGLALQERCKVGRKFLGGSLLDDPFLPVASRSLFTAWSWESGQQVSCWDSLENDINFYPERKRNWSQDLLVSFELVDIFSAALIYICCESICIFHSRETCGLLIEKRLYRMKITADR